MQRALVIRTAGDPAIAGAIVAGMDRASEYKALRDELVRLRKVEARAGVRDYGDQKRWERTKRRLARKYYVRPMGRIEGAVLGAWAGLWMAIGQFFQAVQALAEGKYEHR